MMKYKDSKLICGISEKVVSVHETVRIDKYIIHLHSYT